MTNNPLVTIGAVNYNNERFIIETLDSIKAQTYSNIELILIDDCSTDKSVELIIQWLKGYGKSYKFIQHKKNLGVCAGGNAVLTKAIGKYISLIATDDIMMPEKIEAQVNILENSPEDIGAVYSDAYLIREDSSLMKGLFIERYRCFATKPTGFIYENLIESNFLPAMSLMVKKECYNEVGFFDEDLVFEDYDMWLRISKKYKILYSEYISAKYRIRNNSLMSVTRNWDTSTIKILFKHLKESPFLINRLEDLGVGSYCNNDRASILSLKPAATFSFKLKIIMLLHYLKVPKSIGLFILKRI